VIKQPAADFSGRVAGTGSKRHRYIRGGGYDRSPCLVVGSDQWRGLYDAARLVSVMAITKCLGKGQVQKSTKPLHAHDSSPLKLGWRSIVYNSKTKTERI
jgi:hypothetical protein